MEWGIPSTWELSPSLVWFMVVGGAGESLPAQITHRDGTDLHWVSAGIAEILVLLVSLCSLQDKTSHFGVDRGVSFD